LSVWVGTHIVFIKFRDLGVENISSSRNSGEYTAQLKLI
jgi:hypothetical protein